jgi:hypothetical protein
MTDTTKTERQALAQRLTSKLAKQLGTHPEKHAVTFNLSRDEARAVIATLALPQPVPAGELGRCVDALVGALADSKGWLRGYAEAIILDAIDRNPPPKSWGRLLELASEEFSDAAAHMQHGADTLEVPEWARIVSTFATHPQPAQPSTQEPVACKWCVGSGQWSDHACRFCNGKGVGSVFASPVTQEPQEASMLHDLLAVIHRDGGHYVAEHGLEKALADAHTLVLERRSEEPPAEPAAPVQAGVELLSASAIHGIWKDCKANGLDYVAFAWKVQKAAEAQGQPAGLFEALEHGDVTHRAWLKEAIACFFSGRPIPPATPQPQPPAGQQDEAGALHPNHLFDLRFVLETLEKALPTHKRETMRGDIEAAINGMRYIIKRTEEAAAPTQPPGEMPQGATSEQIEKAIESLVKAAWAWGESCGVDSVAFNEEGDSHNRWMRDEAEKAKDAVYSLFVAPTPAAGPSVGALQSFESPRAKRLMAAWSEGWAACRDAEFIGEEAENDRFNHSSTLDHCIAEDILHATPPPGAGLSVEAARQTDLSKKLRLLYGALEHPHNVFDRRHLLQAADEIERYYGGMLAWKATAEAKDAARLALSTWASAQQAAGVELPSPGSPEASALMDSVLAEYNNPSNPKNAARAGWMAAKRWLAAARSVQQKASGGNAA